MKKIIYILASAFWAFASCSNEPGIDPGPDGETTELSFVVNIPDARGMTRAAWDADGLDELETTLITNMYVLVFDANGFLSRHKAEQGASLSQFTVQLPTSDKPRVLHFICNYDKWAQFSDEDAYLQNEATVLANLYVEGQRVVYWQRTELSNGINSGTATYLAANPVHLVRNVAKISVINNSLAAMQENNDITSYLTNIEFGIGNYFNRGTVTAFNRTNGTFDGNSILEAPGATAQTITASDFVPAHSAKGASDGKSLLTYERWNSNPNSEDHLYLIIKGTYVDTANPTYNGQTRYYKIDIVKLGEETLYDIQRNQHYVMTINLVMNSGYGTLSEAINALSLNNVATSVMQSYNSISDGTALLNVEYTNKLFVRGGENFAIRYSYIPDARSQATDNRDVQMSWDTPEDASAAVSTVNAPPNRKFPGSELGGEDLDYITGTLVPSAPASGVAESHIRVWKSNLSRVIIMRLRQPYDFGTVAALPNLVGTKMGESVGVTLNIPAALEDQLPFVLYINAPSLLPDITRNSIYFDDTGSSTRYRYTVTRTGEHTLYFKTGAAGVAGESKQITLESNLFSPKSTSYTRVTLPPIDNLSVTPNGSALKAKIGEAVRVSFRLPAGYTQGQAVYIFTNALSLDTSSGNGGTSDGGSISRDPSNQFYRYVPVNGGQQTLTVYFKTNVANSRESLIIDSDNLSSASMLRSSNIRDLFTVDENHHAVSGFTPAGIIYNTNSEVREQVSITMTVHNEEPAAGAETVIVYIRTLYLEPAGTPQNGTISAIVPSDNAPFDYGYKYVTSVVSAQETRALDFRFKSAVRTPETLMFASDKYNTAYYNYFYNLNAWADPKPRNNRSPVFYFSVPTEAVSPGNPVTIVPYGFPANTYTPRVSQKPASASVTFPSTTQIVVDTPGNYAIEFTRGSNGTTTNGVYLIPSLSMFSPSGNLNAQ